MLRPSSLAFCGVVVWALLAVVCCQAPPAPLVLSFTPQTVRAPWAARFSGTVEQLNINVTANGVTYPSGSFVLHGGQTAFDGGMLFNDVWISSNAGVSWTQINSGAQSYTPTYFAGYTTDLLGRLYKVAGRNAAGQLTNEVWLSTNGGVSWSRRTPTAPNRLFPPRAFPEVMTNSVNELEVAAGLSGDRDNGPGLADLWKSTDQGANWWREADLPVNSPPGRSSASFLQFATPALAYKSVLWYFGGYSRTDSTSHAYHNDIWLSTDYGGSWQAITTAAPWSKRANFNAEITNSGVIIMSAGYNDYGPGGADNDLNDVWASLDGGWTWGQCAEDASFSDRRWQMTLLDNQGFFYIFAGDVGVNNSTVPRGPVNDVWRSTLSFNDAASVSRMCNVSMPICGPGLRCLPGANTRIVNGRVTCAATELCTSTRLGFTVLTSSAQWSVRHTAGLEITKAAVTAAGASYPAGSMVLWGGVGYDNATNTFDALLTDTFVSSNGATWAAVSRTGFAGAVGSAHCTDSKGRLYKIGGERNGAVVNDVWMSTSIGRTWTKQTPSSANRVFSPRAFADVYADSTDALFLVGGRGYSYTAAGMNDVWTSSNAGRDWTRQGVIPFSQAGGRFSASLLISYSKLLRKDVLTYIGGYSRLEGGGMDQYYNDIWLSSTAGKQWTRLTATAAFVERDNANAEVTKDGVLVVVAGYNSREALNDVWISADGGYTWGQCNAEAQFSDRRWQMTVMDNRGLLYIAGGEEVESGRSSKQSDVYRSTVSLTSSKGVLTTACPGVKFPTCTSGLSCWPGSNVRMSANNGATCSTLTQCNLYPDEDESSSTGGEELPPAPTPSSGGGLSTGTIALIVVAVLAVVAAAAFFLYKRSGKAAGSGQEGLLEGGGHTGSSLPSGTAFHTLTTEHQG